MTSGKWVTIVAVASIAIGVKPAAAEDPPPMFNTGPTFTEQTGEALFKNVCQGCHMPDARGAQGAGAYPALADNPKLADGGYPIYAVLHGVKSMPPVGRMMSNAQIAAVVNYVRSHFGNAYKDEVTARQVADFRK